ARDDVEVQTHTDLETTGARVPESLDRVVVSAHVDDERRRGDDARLHRLEDPAIDAFGEAEIVGVDDEPFAAHRQDTVASRLRDRSESSSSVAGAASIAVGWAGISYLPVQPRHRIRARSVAMVLASRTKRTVVGSSL